MGHMANVFYGIEAGFFIKGLTVSGPRSSFLTQPERSDLSNILEAGKTGEKVHPDIDKIVDETISALDE